jgi:hypothetical protein
MPIMVKVKANRRRKIDGRVIQNKSDRPSTRAFVMLPGTGLVLRRNVEAATKELIRAHARNEKTRRQIDRVQRETDEVLARISDSH